MKNLNIEEHKKRIERIIILSTLFIGYLYIFIYQEMLNMKFDLSFQTIIKMPIIGGVIYYFIYYLIKSDPLQRGSKNIKEIRFFQNEFPSKYLLERCERCIENEKSCPNYIKAESYSHIRYWFHHILHGEIEKENPKSVKDTFEKGYICKLLYAIKNVLKCVLVLSILTICVYHIYLYFSNGKLLMDLNSFQVFFPIILLSINILINKINRVDEKNPTGCWQAWREINRMHISWMRSNEDFIKELICHDGGNKRSFKEK